MTNRTRWITPLSVGATVCWLLLGASALAQEPVTPSEQPPAKAETPKEQENAKGARGASPSASNLRRLSPQRTGLGRPRRANWWLSAPKSCCEKGCWKCSLAPKGTKEHESIVAIDGKASTVHAGLIAMGFQPGSAGEVCSQVSRRPRRRDRLARAVDRRRRHAAQGRRAILGPGG